MTRKFGRSSVLEIPTWCGRNLQNAASHRKPRKLPPGASSRPGYLCRFFPHHEAFFSTLLTELPLVSTFAGTGPNSEKRISSRGLTIGLHWPIAPQSPQTSEQGRWFQPVGEIFINKGQTNRSILREKKRCWHRQLP
jgi:hypothetical protein